MAGAERRLPEHVGTTLTDSPDPTARVAIDVPADPRFLQVLRVAAAAASLEVIDDFQRIDDLRLAIDELSAAAIDSAHRDARIDVEIWADGDAVRVRGRVRAREGDAAPALSDIGQLLVASVSRSYRLDRDGEDVVFELVLGTSDAGRT